ncbi:MAG: GtrA family protein [Bacteroidales bacterium]|nr:GtrA family protein [Bacteroidales bacterium]
MHQIYSRYRNFILYTCIGGVCTLVDIGVFYLLQHTPIHYLIANIISYNCGIIVSFFLNQRYNFKVKDKTASRFFSFYMVSLLGMIICEGVLWLLVDGCHLNSLLAKVLATIFVGLMQFLYVKRFTFKKSAARIE